VLFADPEAMNKARAATIAARDSDKKLSLPDIIPGFKANSLDVREYLSSYPFFSSMPSAVCTLVGSRFGVKLPSCRLKALQFYRKWGI